MIFGQNRQQTEIPVQSIQNLDRMTHHNLNLVQNSAIDTFKTQKNEAYASQMKPI